MNKIILFVITFTAIISLSACTAKIDTSPPQPQGTITSVTASEQTQTGNEQTAAETPTTTESTAPSANEKPPQLSLSIEQKVGQILLGRFPESGAAEIMGKYQLGGFTLYASDFKNETPDTVPRKIGAVQEKALVPAFIAVDEEGGTVVRVSKFPQYRPLPFSSQIALARGGEELVREETEEKSKLLLSLGINLNLAPVADFTEDHSAYIFDRTFGCGLEETCDYVALCEEVMNENRIGSCLKHFPGYGGNVDTHTGIAVDSRTREDFEAADFLPFIKGIEAGAPAVMVCHNIVNAFDSELPASLSPAVHQVLREELGFEGVIISDDMGMDAILEYSGDESPYVLAVLAGNDLICVSDIEEAYEAILAAVRDGRITEEKLNESVSRIISMKKSLGILN